MRVNISFVQMDVVFGEREKNQATIQRLTENLPENCDFLVLPELWNIGYDLEHLDQKAESLDGASIQFLKFIAKKHNVNIIGGSIAEKKDGVFYNTMPVISRKGELIDNYRKVHLFSHTLKEPDYFAEGDEWGLTGIDGLTCGLMLCYDLRFPAFCRNLVLRDASVIFVPAQWPAARRDHYVSLLKARAIENQVYVIGVNRCGKDRISYGGGSMIVSPDGTVLADADEEEKLVSCDIYVEEDHYIRKMIPVFQDRRNILDEIDNNLF